jgi:HK97 gp10 family phage protein
VIRVTVKGSQELLKIMDLMPNRMRLALFKAMRDTAIIIQSLAKKNAPVWRGLLRASIVQTVTIEGNQIVGTVGSALPYAKVLEFGRTQGWRPNIDQLRLWARRRLSNEHAGYGVAEGIRKRGFRAQPYLTPALEEAGSRTQLIFTGRILEALAEVGGG